MREDVLHLLPTLVLFDNVWDKAYIFLHLTTASLSIKGEIPSHVSVNKNYCSKKESGIHLFPAEVDTA